MRKGRNEAIVMRQSGMSYSDIKSRLAIPKSTLSSWFKDQKWSNEVARQCAKNATSAAAMRITVLNTIRGSRLSKLYEEARQDALVDFHELKFHPLFISGLLLYWSHGNKVLKQPIVFSSSDVKKIKIFKLFLESVCGVRNYRIQLIFNSNCGQEEDVKMVWMRNCGFSSGKFLKNVKMNAKCRSNKPYFGICNVIVNSAYLKNKILKWIELFYEEICQETYLKEIEDHTAGIV